MIMLTDNLNHYHSSATASGTQQAPTSQRRTTLRRWLRPVVILFLILITAAIGFILLTNLLWTGLPSGSSAPHVQGTALNGQPVDLTQQRGQPVMLTFWSPDCFACREELPALQALAADPQVDLHLITVVSGMEAAAVEQFVAAQGLTFPVLVDPAGTIAAAYEVSGIPFTYFINQNGLIDGAVRGAGQEGDLQASLFSWLQSCQIGAACSVE